MNYKIVRTVTLISALLIVGLVAPASHADRSRLSDNESAGFTFLNGWTVGVACQDPCPSTPPLPTPPTPAPAPRIMNIALKAANQKYVAAEGGGGGELVADRDKIGPWETFKVTYLDNNRLALQASNGKYVCAENGGGGAVVANRDRIGEWETFVMVIVDGGRIALQTHDGHYLCAEGGGGRQLVADRVRIGPWESFYLLQW